MYARKYDCRVLENVWVTPTVFRIRFRPSKGFAYEAGQFVSVVVPDARSPRPLKRLYSLASPPEEAMENGYELCVKFVPGGAGSEYLSGLRPGDEFQIVAPYGEYRYVAPAPGRSVCFIATGTGIGPIRAMALSEPYLLNPPSRALCLMGSRNEDEILYRKVLEAVGIETVYALSRPSPAWSGFHGRVTDYLRRLPSTWSWHTTDFYVCGNAAMIAEVRDILVGGHGVRPQAIRAESFSAMRATPARPEAEAEVEPRRAPIFRLPWFEKKAA